MNRKSFAQAEIKAADKGQVVAKIATLNVIDKDGDVILPGALQRTDVVISAYGHESWSGSLPVGKGVFYEEGDALMFEGEFFMDTTHGRDTFITVKNLGALGEWSYSLQNVTSEPVQVDGVRANGIKGFGATEVSPVLVGASVGSETLSTKSASLTFSQHADAVLAAIDELTARASEVVALRAEKGKSISDESAELLKALASRVDAVKAVLNQPATTVPEADINNLVANEFARFAFLSTGVTS
jgi:hypothetical protein